MTPSRSSNHPFRFAFMLGLAACAFCSTPAAAGPIVLGDWNEFGFSETGVPATGCDPADPAGPFCIPSSGTPTTFLDTPPWTFTAPAEGATLTVTDAFLSGDRFEIFDFGISIGLTSLPVAGVVLDCGNDPANCLATAGVSSGLFSLAAGNHSITLVPVLSPLEGGAGFLRADAIVPEPTTLLLVGSGLILSIRRVRRMGRTKEAL